MTMDREGDFDEDMEEKAKWFELTHGRQTNEERRRQLQAAMAHLRRAREARATSLDPGGELPSGEYAVASGGTDCRIELVGVPHPSPTQNFATKVCAVASDGRFCHAVMKLRPLSEAQRQLELSTAKTFLYDRQTRQWRLVEQSGYNAAAGFLWFAVHRSGLYATIALPADPGARRKLALLYYAQQHVLYGVETGLLSCAAEYFTKANFEALVADQRQLSRRQLSAGHSLEDELRIYAETLALQNEWPRQFPRGGFPEWQIMSHLTENDPEKLRALGLGDIILRNPLRQLADRVGRWKSLGPWNVSGRIKSLAIHPTDSSVLYAGAANGGVWKSRCGGESWFSAWNVQDTMAIGSLCIAPSAPDTLYAATGEDAPGWGEDFGGTGIYKSTDAGGSWSQVAVARQVGAHCSRIIVHPTDDHIVFVASERGVYRTRDGGVNWRSVLPGHASDIVIAHDDPAVLYAGIWNDGIYKTTDGGDTWNRLQGDIIVQEFLWGLVVRSPFPTGNVAGWIKLAIGRNGGAGSSFVVAKLGQDSSVVLSTADAGASWHPMQTVPGTEYDEWTSLLAVHPDDPTRVFAGGVGLYYSKDGATFSACSGTHADHHTMVFHPTRPEICFVATDGGVYRSKDRGVTWSLSSDDLCATQMLSLGVSQQGEFVIGGATQDQGIIQSSGNEYWSNFGGGDEWGMFVVDPNDSRNIYISPKDGQLRRSTDRGRHYTNPTDGLTDYWPSQKRQTIPASFRHLAVQPGNSNVLLGAAVVSEEIKDKSGAIVDAYPATYRLYWSSNKGDKWSVALTLIDEMTRVAYAPSHGDRVYAATVNGRLLRSDKGGQGDFFEPYAAADRPPVGGINCITVDPTDADTLYLAYGSGSPNVVRTTNGGRTFQPVNGTVPAKSLPDISVHSLVIDPENSDVLYVGTVVGVFRSSDAGATWHPYNDSIGEDDMPIVEVTALAHHAESRRLFAATIGRGVYYTFTSGLVAQKVVAISHYYRGIKHVGIQYLRVDAGGKLLDMSRQEVIRRLEAGSSFYTVGADGSQADVLVMPRDAQHKTAYLTTLADNTTADNLLSLPEFFVWQP